LTVDLTLDFKINKVRLNVYSGWRYAFSFPYVKKTEIVTLGEGWTPLIKFSENTYFKLESANPTGSFKDRGSTVLISATHKLIKESGSQISEDSSGNAGASIAAYAARAALKAKIYVPQKVSGPKLNQIKFFGAEVIKVSGSRNRVAILAQKPEEGKLYIGHILHPLFRDGLRSLSYEITEQLNWQAPDRIYLPVSAGTLLLGLMEGYAHLLQSNIIESMPRIVACQTKQVSPIYHLFNNLSYSPLSRITSIADALVSVNPPLLNIVVDHLRRWNGDAVIVDENEILTAFNELACQGFFVEPSSAVAYAGYKKQRHNQESMEHERTVLILTGTGLKSQLIPNK
jgi:threonine synthase